MKKQKKKGERENYIIDVSQFCSVLSVRQEISNVRDIKLRMNVPPYNIACEDIIDIN